MESGTHAFPTHPGTLPPRTPCTEIVTTFVQMRHEGAHFASS